MSAGQAHDTQRPAGGPLPDDAPIGRYQRRSTRAATWLLVLVVAAWSATQLLSGKDGLHTLSPGDRLPPFAVPLALSKLSGDANVATHSDDGEAGRIPACLVRGPDVLNVCQLAERKPAVLALFVDAGSCSGILTELQRVEASFPGVQFAAVQVKGSRDALRELVRADRLSLPVGYDHDGILAGMYGMVSCPEVVLAKPGGIIARKPILGAPTVAGLRADLTALALSTPGLRQAAATGARGGRWGRTATTCPTMRCSTRTPSANA